ncbi:hypothetical protein GA0115257_10718 [Streptomyces sp. LcepLS]|nr:hypothetical protein GA0115257_10718 [Streptomyces sp. LcepLS]
MACAAVPDWFGGAFPGEAIVLSARTADTASTRRASGLGLAEAARYRAPGAPGDGSARAPALRPGPRLTPVRASPPAPGSPPPPAR